MTDNVIPGLGDVVMHIPTGKSGFVTGIARYVYGSPEALLSSKDPPEAEWVSLAALRVLVRNVSAEPEYSGRVGSVAFRKSSDTRSEPQP